MRERRDAQRGDDDEAQPQEGRVRGARHRGQAERRQDLRHRDVEVRGERRVALVRVDDVVLGPAGHGVGDVRRGVVAVARAGELADDRGAVRVEERVGARRRARRRARQGAQGVRPALREAARRVVGLGLDRHGDAPEERHEQRAERARGVRDLGADARGAQRQAEAPRRGRGPAQGRGEAQHAPARAARPQARRRVDDERERERRREAQQHEVAAEHRRQVRRAPVEPAQRRALAVRAGRLLAERRERAQTQTRHEEEREEDGADAPLGAAEVARQVRVDRAEADGRQHGAREVQT